MCRGNCRKGKTPFFFAIAQHALRFVTDYRFVFVSFGSEVTTLSLLVRSDLMTWGREAGRSLVWIPKACSLGRKAGRSLAVWYPQNLFQTPICVEMTQRLKREKQAGCLLPPKPGPPKFAGSSLVWYPQKPPPTPPQPPRPL